ncbi:MAG: metal ABC transporter permease [Planctomycetota bacterium]
MISDFLASWPLFQNTYLSGWLSSVLLALVGVALVTRDQMFLGAAIAQASTLGVALHIWLSSIGAGAIATVLSLPGAKAVIAFGCAVIAALATARPNRESREAVAAWLFLGCGSLAVLLVAQSPHGRVEVEQLLTRSILGASAGEMWTLAVATSALLFLAVKLERPLRLVLMDSAFALAVGMPMRRWTNGIAIIMGGAVGLALPIAGLTYTFCSLVLPPLIARRLVRELRTLLWVAPVIALISSIASSVLAHALDWPPAHTLVLVQSALLAACWSVTRRS